MTRATQTTPTEAAELRALRELFPGVEHAVRGPMNGLVLQLELARLELGAERTAGLQREVQRLIATIEAMLRAIGSDSSPAADLTAAFNGLTRLLAPSARQRHIRLATAAVDRPVVVDVRAEATQAILLVGCAAELARLEPGASARCELAVVDRGLAALSWSSEQRDDPPDDDFALALDWLRGAGGDGERAAGPGIRAQLHFPIACSSVTRSG